MARSSQTLTNLAFHLLGANRIVRTKQIRQLELTGLTEDEIRPVLKDIRSLHRWQQQWTILAEQQSALANNATDASNKSSAHFRAAAMYYMADILHLPRHPDHLALTQKMVRAYHAYGETSHCFERRVIQCGSVPLHCNLYHPNPGTPLPIVIMIPPLGSVKEQIDFQVMPFYKAGYACIAVDLPGVGESLGPMPLDAQFLLRELVSYLEKQPDIAAGQIAIMGLSLGAYWSMKTAAIDPRIKLAIGVSTPAISGKHWNRLPAHYWQYFQNIFCTPDLTTTRQTTEQLSLFHVMDKITCPVLLIHGQKDRISQPDAMTLFYQETTNAPLTTRIYPQSAHCCLEKVKHDILPFTLSWFEATI